MAFSRCRSAMQLVDLTTGTECDKSYDSKPACRQALAAISLAAVEGPAYDAERQTRSAEESMRTFWPNNNKSVNQSLLLERDTHPTMTSRRAKVHNMTDSNAESLQSSAQVCVKHCFQANFITKDASQLDSNFQQRFALPPDPSNTRIQGAYVGIWALSPQPRRTHRFAR